MRFISEDNKVFNTIEECQEHEASIKKESDAKKEERRKEALKGLQKRHVSIINQIDEWLDDYDNYLNEYRDSDYLKKNIKGKDDLFDLRDFMKFLDIVFGEYENEKE